MVKWFDKIDRQVACFLILLVFFAALIRGYNFKEWLLVRADQVRDAEIAKEFMNNGIGELRLLGPKITKVKLPGEKNGDTFRMGPYYYYSQALAMKIFGDPSFWTIAVFDFISSLLAIPLFFLVISQFFSRKVSFLVTIFFSFSFLIIQYSRFSWNPNQLIFWQLFFIYFLLKFEEAKKNRAGKYLIWALVSLLIISQLHFLATIGTVLVFISFFIYRKGWKKLKRKHYLIAAFIFLVFHSPMIASDIKNNGDNLKRMWYGVFQQSSEESLAKNFKETIEKSSRFYFYFPLPITEEEFENIVSIRMLYLLMSIGLISLVFLGKVKNLDKIRNKKVLSFLILVYFGAFFFANVGMADRLEKPRYWLSIAPISFLILAFWFELIWSIKKKWLAFSLVLIAAIFIIFENGYSIYYWYASLEKGEKLELPFKDPILRPHRNLITLGQIDRISEYMKTEAQKEDKGVCYLCTDYQVKNAFKYVINYKFPKTLIKNLNETEDSSKDCKMFLIIRADQEIESVKEDFTDRFNYEKIYRDGALVLWEIKVSDENDLPAKGEEIFYSESSSKENRVELWREIFEK